MEWLVEQGGRLGLLTGRARVGGGVAGRVGPVEGGVAGRVG